MISNTDLSGLYRRLVPGLQSATLRVPARPIGETVAYTDYSLNNAKRRPLTIDERALASVEVLGAESCVWLLWKEDLDAAGAPAPREGDRVVDPTQTGYGGAPQEWVARSVAVHLMGQSFMLTCTRTA